MSSYQYVKMPKSIEDTSFEYMINLDTYKTLIHILDMVSIEKLKKPALIGIFRNISKLFDRMLKDFEKIAKNNILDLNLLKAYIKKPINKIILVKNPDYNSFASFESDFETVKNLESPRDRTVFYNIGQLETTGAISIIPVNVSVFMSSFLYSYALLFSNEFYKRQTYEVFVNISKIFYTLLLSSFGRKGGLLVGARLEKELLFFLTASFVFSSYARSDTKTSDKLESFLKMASATTGSSYLKEYLHKISNVDLLKKGDIYQPENYDSVAKLTNIAKQLGILEITESDVKVQFFRLLGVYGVLGLENYVRLVSYLIATYIPNTYFSTAFKVYHKDSYEYLVEYFVKDLFTLGR